MRLFWKKGYEGSHLGELVEVTGLNRFALYKEFGGKEGLYRDAMQLYLAKLGDISSPLQQEPYGWANLEEYFNNVAGADFIHGCFFVNAMVEKKVIPPPVFADVTAFARGAMAALKQNVEAAQKSGAINPDADPETVTKFLFSFDIGFITSFITDHDKGSRRKVLDYLYSVLQHRA